MEGVFFTYFILAGVGFSLGFLYFQGLWWTLKGLTPRKRWMTRFLVSFILRSALVVTVFYLLMENDWRRISVLTMGFLAARVFLIRRIGGNPDHVVNNEEQVS